MRKILTPFALLLTQLSFAATPVEGWYGSVFGGYAYLPNNISTSWGGLTRTEAKYRGGFDAGGSVGFKCTPLRYEGEVTYIKADLKNFEVNNVEQTGVDGYSNAYLGMANVYYDFPSFESLQPYLGIGIGYGWAHARLDSEGPPGLTRFSGSNSVFAYQPILGITYNFAENYALNVGYRYIGTDRVDDLGKVFQAHLANVGIVYRFNQQIYK